MCSEPKLNQDIFIRNFFQEVLEAKEFINITNNSFDKYDLDNSSSDLSLNDNEKLYYLNINKNKLDSKVFRSRKLCTIKRSKSVLNIEGFGSKTKMNKVNEPHSIKQFSKAKMDIKELSIKRKISDKESKMLAKKISGIKLIDDLNLLSDTEEDEEIAYDNNMALTLNNLNKKAAEHSITNTNATIKDKEISTSEDGKNCIIF